MRKFRNQLHTEGVKPNALSLLIKWLGVMVLNVEL